MKHILYKTINLLNGRFYIGMHSAENPDDGYLGSGRRLKAEIKKYGKENFKREVLETLPSRKALEEREAQIVTEELRSDPNCLNLKNGGEGGGKFWSEEHQRKCTAAASIKRRGNCLTNAHRKALSTTKIGNLNFANSTRFAGHLHTEETKRKMRKSKNKGEANSQFGTCWVSKDSKPIKIKKEQLDEYLANGYSRGRK